MEKQIILCSSCAALNRLPVGKVADPKCGKCGAALDVPSVQELTDQTVRRFIDSAELPVVIDFWAPWCAPCRGFAPTFEQAAKEFFGKVQFVKLNTQDNRESAAAFGIRGIPTLAVFKNGTEIRRASGALPLSQFRDWLSAVAQLGAQAQASGG